MDGFLVFEEPGDGVPLAGGQRFVRGVGHGDREVLVFKGHAACGDIDGDFELRVALDLGGEHADVGTGGDDARDAERGAIAEEDLGKAFGDDGADAETIQRLRSVLAGAATAEV